MFPLVTAKVEKSFAEFSVMLLPEPAATVVTPVTVSTPLCVTAPPVFTPKVPLTVDAPRISAFVSVTATLLPEVIVTVLKLLAAEFSVMSFPEPAANVATPPMTSVPLSVITPAVVTPSVPVMLIAPRSIAPVSFSAAFVPFVMATVEKLFALSSVMLFAAPGASVVVPVTASAPLSVMFPADVTPNVPEIVEAFSAIAFVSTSVTFSALVIPTLAKLFPELSSVTLFAAPAANVAAPPTTKLPTSEIAPAAVTFSAPVMLIVTKAIAFTSFKVAFVPFVIVTDEKSFAPSSVMLFAAPGASVAVLPIVSTPLSVMFPADVTLSVPVRLMLPRSIALESTNVAFVPLVMTTVEKLFELLSVMLFAAPGVNVVVPVTTTLPLSVIAPADVIVSVPETVEAFSAIAFTSTSVTFSAFVIPTLAKSFAALSSVMLFAAPAASVAAPPITSVPLSVIAPAAVTPSVPVMLIAPRSIAPVSFSAAFVPFVIATVEKLFALSSVMLFAAPGVSVVVPVTASAPLSVMFPAVTTVNVPLTVEAPRISAFASVTETLLPVVTANVEKSFAEFSVMLFAAPAANVATPAIVSAPVWVIAPLEVAV